MEKIIQFTLLAVILIYAIEFHSRCTRSDVRLDVIESVDLIDNPPLDF